MVNIYEVSNYANQGTMADDEALARQLQAQFDAEREQNVHQARLQEVAALEAEFEVATQALLEEERKMKEEGQSQQSISKKK